ncbi:MAG: hypothetical protein EZS28_013055 [Streblomastix strix]|uniref:Uncharacterized protein n=1 Tax=Streblomastix strix TaxID=222440 RepID=A0A5J4WAL0_9EUKA|nr:MAG: hypothetical protein EZS28_013055 [Streblomastix strix]
MTHLASLREILDSWNVDIEIPFKEYVDKVNMREFGWQITEEGTIDKMSDEIVQACVNGLKNLEIHNYPQPINMEISLLSVFSGIYGITNEQIRAEGMKNIRQYNNLTPNAEKNYGEASFNGKHKPNPWILTKMLRYHNKDYYQQTIKSLLKQNYEVKKQQEISDSVQQIEKHEIDLKDPFTLIDIAIFQNSPQAVEQPIHSLIRSSTLIDNQFPSAPTSIVRAQSAYGSFNPQKFTLPLAISAVVGAAVATKLSYNATLSLGIVIYQLTQHDYAIEQVVLPLAPNVALVYLQPSLFSQVTDQSKNFYLLSQKLCG